MPAWLRGYKHVAHVEIKHADTLIQMYEQFQSGTLRFLLAFRHPTTSDPPCIAHLLWNQLPQLARQRSYSIKQPVHVHFVYDRGIPLWAGSFVGWLASKLGGTPIRRGALDGVGLRSIRNLLINGQFPLAIAPEGGTNGHNEIVSPIEPGIAQFGFWCVDDLQKANRSEEVLIVPLGIQYRYVTPPWKALEHLLSQLEQDSGLPSPSPSEAAILATLTDREAPTVEQESLLYRRLYHLGEHLLSLLEQFYSTYYQQTIAQPVRSDFETPTPPLELSPSAANDYLAQRLQTLLNAALDVAEQSLGVKSKGTLADRCRRVEQAAWNRIYRDDIKNLESWSPVQQGLADLVAEEADLRIWHMRLVENFVSVTGKYVAEKPTVERFADTILLVWRTVNQLKGNAQATRPNFGAQTAQITVGEPLSVSDRWDDYQHNRRRAIAQLTQDLQSSLEQMIT